MNRRARGGMAVVRPGVVLESEENASLTPRTLR